MHIGCPEGSTLNFHILALISSRAFLTVTVDNVALPANPGPTVHPHDITVVYCVCVYIYMLLITLLLTVFVFYTEKVSLKE